MPSLRHNAPLARDMRRTGKPASRQTNKRLLERARAGDKQAIDRMIQANMALVVRKAQVYLRSRPKLAYLADDLISEGFVALTNAVHRLAASGPTKTENLVGYLSISINYAFSNYLDHGTSASAGTARNLCARGEQLPQSVGEPSDSRGFDPSGFHDLREELTACCRNDFERDVLRLRVDGYSHSEIGKKLGKPTTTVFNARRAIEARFKKRGNANLL